MHASSQETPENEFKSAVDVDINPDLDADVDRYWASVQRTYRRRWYQFWLPAHPPPPPPASFDDASEIPFASTNLWSILTYGWITPMMTLGWQRPLEPEDLWKIDHSRSSGVVSSKLNAAWLTRVKRASEWNAKIDAGLLNPSQIRKIWWTLRGFGRQDKFQGFEDRWRVSSRVTPSLAWSLNDAFGPLFWSSGLFLLAGDTASLMGPLVTKSIIRFTQEKYDAQQNGQTPPHIGRGIVAAIGLFFLTIMTSICQHQFFWRSMSAGILARSALIGSLYSRGLTLTPGARMAHPNGALVNHVSTDISRIDYCAQWFHPIWTSPIQVSICLILLCIQLGPSALAGFSLFVILTPIQERAITYQLGRRRASMKYTDQRATLLQELLGAMRVIKYFTYEVPFLKRLGKLRKQELKSIRSLLLLRAATQAVAFSIPVLASVLAFVTYALSGHDLDPAIIFTSLSLFALLRNPLMLLPRAFSSITDGQNALSRLSRVFSAETLTEDIVIQEGLEYALVVANADFQWEEPAKAEGKSKKKGTDGGRGPQAPTSQPSPDPFSLKDINLKVPRGQLCAIVGTVGSGKSSLLQGLIGEMRRTRGSVSQGGTLAYCPQIPWIQNATLRDNILFGKEWNEERYWKAIQDSSLIFDLEILPDGDLTEIGEKGINLSGGQKARVNVARALYSDSNIIVMDDPLAAVDIHVGKALFEDAILGASVQQGKTVILVTHALHFLPQVDYIYTLLDGRIQEQGTYAELVKAGGVFSILMRDFGSGGLSGHGAGGSSTNQDDDSNTEAVTSVSKSKTLKLKNRGQGNAEGTGKIEGHLIRAEQRKRGAISASVYKGYLAAGGGVFTTILVVSTAVIMQTATVLTSYWLVWWQNNHFKQSSGFYMGLYAGLGVAQAILTFVLGAVMSFQSYRASTIMHKESVETIFHAPMSFFDTTPLGRILGVLGKDIDTMDNTLSDVLRMLAYILSSLVGSIILIAIVFPYFLAIVTVISLAYMFFAKFYTVSSREMKRIDAHLRSHLYSHFAESLSGLATIRAYGETQRFKTQNEHFIDLENRALYLTITNQRWLAIRLDFLGGILICIVGIMAVVGVNGASSAQIGLVLTYTVSITQILGVVTRQTAEVENNMNSVERIFNYGPHGNTPQEAAHEVHNSPTTKIPAWPTRGHVQFRDVVMSYRPGLPEVLKEISLDATGGQKIGVVGRTGAGKSSLMGALFRLTELTSGSISIDEIDISMLGLRELRQQISIIPQEPLLFSGTIRSNLDPFMERDEATLWDALRRAHLIDNASAGSDSRFTLETRIEPEGANLSVGERSLLSLARALCKDSRIVVLDEATASVDLETDSKIQETILREFHDKTLLCIAHRLRTVINYEKILVLDQGKVVEFDTPLALFDLEEGVFRGMCEGSIGRKDIELAQAEKGL